MNLWKLHLLLPGLLVGLSMASAQTGLETPQLLVCEADALRDANSYTAAYSAYERAYPYYAAVPDYYKMAYLKTWASEMAYEGGAGASKGDAAVQEAYKIANEHLNTDTLSFFPLTLINMALCFSRSGDYEKQMALQHAGKRAAQRIHGKYSTYSSLAYTNLGYAYGYRGNWKKSLAYSDTALMIASRIGDPDGVFGAQNNRAHGYAELGDFEQALITQQIALEAAVEQKDYARAANNLGVLYVDVKEWEKGIAYLEAALAVRRQLSDTLTSNIFSTQLNLVWAYSESNEIVKSDSLLDEVIKAAKAQSPTFDQSSYLQIAYNYLAKNALASGQLNTALERVHQAEGIASNNISTAASTKLVKSMVLRDLNRLEEALWAIQESYQALTPDYAPDDYTDVPDWGAIEAIAYTLTLFQLQAALLDALAAQNQAPELMQAALQTLEAADSAVTASRLSYQSQMSKEMMAANAGQLYAALIDIHYRLYQESKEEIHIKRAFVYMEKNKALSVLENLNAMEAARFHDIPERLVAGERSIREDIAFYQLQLKVYLPEGAAELKKRWERELARLRSTQDSLLAIIEARFPRYYKTRIEMTMPDLKTVQEEILRADETMIEYFQADSALYVVLADKQTAHFIHLPTQDLESKVLALHQALRSKAPEALKVSHQVYQQVFEPLRRYIKGEKLVLIPDGPLSYIPFDQLVMETPESTGKEYLLEHYQIRRLLSGSTALRYEGVQKGARQKYSITALAPLFTSGVGSVRAAEGYGALPGAQKEVDVLDKLFRGGVFLRGPDATEQAFKANCTNSGILHVATHTAINDQFPNASHLLLKETAQEDGRLNVYEIYGQSIPAQLGFLSGCNTGFGKIKAGEGAVSLGHAFAYAGCPNIVMTLWPIKDDLAPDLVRVFYEGLQSGLDKAEALRQAKLFGLKNDALFEHPYYWSGFVYIGDRSPVEFNAFVLSDYLWGIVGVFIAGLIAAGLWRRNKK